MELAVVCNTCELLQHGLTPIPVPELICSVGPFPCCSISEDDAVMVCARVTCSCISVLARVQYRVQPMLDEMGEPVRISQQTSIQRLGSIVRLEAHSKMTSRFSADIRAHLPHPVLVSQESRRARRSRETLQPRLNRLAGNNAQVLNFRLATTLKITPQATKCRYSFQRSYWTGSYTMLQHGIPHQFMDLATLPRNPLEHMSGIQNTLQVGAATSVQRVLLSRREKRILLDRHGIEPASRSQSLISAGPARNFFAICPYPLHQA
jgi:hypothetical protein